MIPRRHIIPGAAADLDTLLWWSEQNLAIGSNLIPNGYATVFAALRTIRTDGPFTDDDLQLLFAEKMVVEWIDLTMALYRQYPDNKIQRRASVAGVLARLSPE